MSKSCDPTDCSPPGSFVHGILQARIVEWAAISFSRGPSWPRDWTRVSHICRQMLHPLSHQGSPRTLHRRTSKRQGVEGALWDPEPIEIINSFQDFQQVNCWIFPCSETLYSPGYVRRGHIISVNTWGGGYPSLPSVPGSPSVKTSRG